MVPGTMTGQVWTRWALCMAADGVVFMLLLLHRPHQGLILDASPLIWREMEQLPDVADLPRQSEPISIPIAGTDIEQDSSSSSSSIQHPVWLALDEVMDPVSFTCMFMLDCRSDPCIAGQALLVRKACTSCPSDIWGGEVWDIHPERVGGDGTDPPPGA
jgi:hypothetical protein